MSMFSQHWLIYNKKEKGYWNGKSPDADCWGKGGGIRIFAKEDAQLIVNGLFPNLRSEIKLLGDE